MPIHRPLALLAMTLLAPACGPDAVATTGAPAESTGSSSTAASTGPDAPTEPPTSTGDPEQTTTTTPSSTTADPASSTATTGSDPSTTADTTGALAETDADTSTGAPPDPSTSSTSSTTTPPDETSEDSTGDPCPADEVVCNFDSVAICDGMGGFKATHPCTDWRGGGCTAGIGCESACDQKFAPPTCPSGYPRIMLLVDASSSMLNLQGGAQRAQMGQGGWEQMRDAIASQGELFTTLVPEGPLEEHAYIGMTVFGHNVPDESKQIVQYGACHRDLLEWALDPATSCVGPGCTDPYADAPISWTTQDGAWIFGEPVKSHMPTCTPGMAPNKGCFGSGTYVHLGLERVQQNLAAYKAACAVDPDEPCDADTQFINIVILDGNPNSTEAQYAPPLQAMFAQGVVTHVIGFGDGVDGMPSITNLNKMASHGSGGALMYRDAQNQAQLEQHLAQIVNNLDFSGC